MGGFFAWFCFGVDGKLIAWRETDVNEWSLNGF